MVQKSRWMAVMAMMMMMMMMPMMIAMDAVEGWMKGNEVEVRAAAEDKRRGEMHAQLLEGGAGRGGGYARYGSGHVRDCTWCKLM